MKRRIIIESQRLKSGEVQWRSRVEYRSFRFFWRTESALPWHPDFDSLLLKLDRNYWKRMAEITGGISRQQRRARARRWAAAKRW